MSNLSDRSRQIEAQVMSMAHALERQRRAVVAATEDVRKARMYLAGILAVLLPQLVISLGLIAWASLRWWTE